MREIEDRRYSPDEFRRILEEATTWSGGSSQGVEEKPSRVSEPTDGLTIDEMREIAREVGIDPTAVERAAGELVSGGTIRVLSPAGKPFASVFHADLRIGRPLSDAQLRAITLEVERVLATQGAVRRTGNGVEWRDAEDRLSVDVIRSADSTLVRVSANQTGEVVKSSVVLGAAGLAVAGAAGTLGLVGFLVSLPLVGVGTAGLIWLYAIGQAATTRDRVQGLLDNLREVARLG
ncbi:MAG: hypothetical protein WD960_04085 [Gemmatimonadota bacterium]